MPWNTPTREMKADVGGSRSVILLCPVCLEDTSFHALTHTIQLLCHVIGSDKFEMCDVKTDLKFVHYTLYDTYGFDSLKKTIALLKVSCAII